MPSSSTIKIIPPVIPAVAMALGAVAHWLWPVAIFSAPLVWGAGAVLIALSFVPALLALWALRRADTTADVRNTSATLVTSGVFRFTRNPMYLAMLMLCAGLALVVNSLAMLVMVLPAAIVLHLAVIRKEEANLALWFGPEYDAYCRSVRRWI